MNAARRKLIKEAVDKLSEVRATLEQAREEEQEYYDNMPESFQNGDKGSAAEEAISALDEAVGDIENASAIAFGCAASRSKGIE